MASTLVTRIGDPDQLTDVEAAAVISEKGFPAETPKRDLKLRINPVVYFASEIVAGRKQSTDMSGWLTATEMADAAILIGKVVAGDLTLHEVQLMFMGIESGIETVDYVENALGLNT